MLLINGITGNYGVTRGRLGGTYNYGPFEKKVRYRIHDPDAKGPQRIITVDVKTKIDTAWRFITQKAAKHEPCNAYFRGLPYRKTLKQILAGRITLHALVPKKGYTDYDLPLGAGAVDAIGLNLLLFAEKGTAEMQATLIHELAHLGGASISKKSLQAETALKHCLMPKHFDPKAYGDLQPRWRKPRHDVRVV